MAKRLYRGQSIELRHVLLGHRSGGRRWHILVWSWHRWRALSGQQQRANGFAGRTLFEYDTRPNYGGNRRRLLVQPNRINQSFLFTNWAGGKEYSAEDPEEYSCDSQSQNIPVGKCQPSSGMPGEGVAIYGHKDREGTWFSVPAEAQKCDATREHSICGYYVEFEEPEGENPIKFAHQVTLDMGRFREFCQSSNQPAG